jgi:ferredoxin
MGSGGLIVMDEDDCMVDVAKFFLEFTVDESCGKCAPCRIGGKQLHALLDEDYQRTGEMQTSTRCAKSLWPCRRHRSAVWGRQPRTRLCQLCAYFEDEYVEHIKERKCRAGKLQGDDALHIRPTSVSVAAPAPQMSVNCHYRRKNVSPIPLTRILCIKCGACYDVCKFDARCERIGGNNEHGKYQN